jgi:hypothetical protein
VIVHELSDEFGVEFNAAGPNVDDCDDGINEVGEERSSVGKTRGEDFENNLPEVSRSRLKEAILKRNVLFKERTRVRRQIASGIPQHSREFEPQKC